MSELEESMNDWHKILTEAFNRAYNGIATEADWAVLRFECGLSALPEKGNENVANSKIQ